MNSNNETGCAKTIGILAGIAAIIGVVIAILAWIMPFSPVGPSPLVPRPTEQLNSNPPIAVQPSIQPTSEPSRVLQTTTFTVVANQSWQNTGVRLSAGDSISIKYLSGLWDWTREYSDFDAQGDPNPQNTCDYISKLVAPGATPGTCAVPLAQVGALVGKIGNDTPFFVGNGYNLTLPNSLSSETMLYLMSNDVFNGLGDNSGQIEVAISVSSR